MAWPSDPESMRVVDIVRAILGMDPLYMNKRAVPMATNAASYNRLESRRRRARPDCLKCEGAGYTSIDTYSGEVRCVCLDETGERKPPMRAA